MTSVTKELSQQQKDLVNKIVNEEKNIFFTGCAGTGKSFVLGHIIEELRTKNQHAGAIAITASTGKAAFNISGVTLHSFAGIQLGKGSKDDVYKKALFNRNSAERWRQVQTLIIDEVSMIDGELFDKLEYVARHIRKNTNPFGGIQLVLSGDLLQLPPVSNNNTQKKRVFEAEIWKDCIQEYIVLTQVFRQQDMEFVRVLTCIRLGAITDEVLEFMKKLEKKKEFGEETNPVELYAIKNKTDTYNKIRLDQILEELVVYKSKDTYNGRKGNNNQLLDNCQAPASLELKKGAQVMLVRNLTRDLVNGTVGVVISFTKKIEGTEQSSSVQFTLEPLPIVRFVLANGRTYTRYMKRQSWDSVSSTGQVLASRFQIPLILAWAVTIHKSQGQTIQHLRANVDDVFECGQLYTALSRAVSPDTLEVVGFDPDRVKVDEATLQFCVDNDLI